MHPTDHPEIFGRNFATRNTLPILVIGKRSYTRYDMGTMGCPHPHAVRELDRVLKQLGVKSIEDLVKHYSPKDFAEVRRFGVTAFYALTCILRDARINLKAFYTDKVTVDTLKEKAYKTANNGHRRRRSAA